MKSVPFCRPDITEDEIAEVVETLQSGWITTGPRTERFETAFAESIGAPWAVAVSSCTAGLHVALVAAGCGEGTEVITTTNTFTATAASILQAGARPVFVDIEPDTFNMDPAAVERAVTSRTKGIIPVHIAGHPCEMDPILDIAQKAGATIIEDAAHALPAAYRGRKIGTISPLTCFSFYATKNLTTGEGGMITGLDPDLNEKVRILGYHGMSRDGWKRYTQKGSWYYEIVEHGFKYNLPDIASAIGLRQLRRLDAMQARRREIVRAYDEAFGTIEGIATPATREHVEHAWHLYAIRVSERVFNAGRDGFIRDLAERGIGTSVHFIPLHLHPLYQRLLGLTPGSFPVANEVYRASLSLPLFSAMTDEEVSRVIKAVTEVAGGAKR
jgi:dTDP-4-amino-4,6-dideoxygalactose transaminase